MRLAVDRGADRHSFGYAGSSRDKRTEPLGEDFAALGYSRYWLQACRVHLYRRCPALVMLNMSRIQWLTSI
jgi:hypothetical protein